MLTNARNICRNTDKAMTQAAEGNDCIRLVTLQPLVITEQLKEDISKMRQTKACCDLKCTNEVLCGTRTCFTMLCGRAWPLMELESIRVCCEKINFIETNCCVKKCVKEI